MLHNILKIVAYKLLESYAAENLKNYLRTYIRSDLIKDINLNSILKKYAQMASDAIKREIGVNDIIEELNDMFIDDKGGQELLGVLEVQARRKGLTPEQARIFVHSGSLTPELEEKLEAWGKEFNKIAFEFIDQFLKRRALEWIAKKKKEEPEDILSEGEEKETEEGEKEGEPERPGFGVKDERELEEEMEREFAWEKGLIEDINKMLDDEIKDDKRRIAYKTLVKERLIEGKSLRDLEKKLGIPDSTLSYYEKDLRLRLENLFRKKGLGPKFDLRSKKIEIPDYRTLLKGDKVLQIELKDWIREKSHQLGEGRGAEYSDFTKKVLNLYAEGLSPEEISSELKGNKKVIENIKSRYFNDAYKSWYMDRVEEIVKTGFHSIVKEAATKILRAVPDYRTALRGDKIARDEVWKRIQMEYKGKVSNNALKILELLSSGLDIPEIAEEIGVDISTVNKIKRDYFNKIYYKWYTELKEPAETGGGVGKIYEKIVDYVFKPGRQRVSVTIEFSSKFDSTGSLARQGVDPEFAWKRYTAEIKERTGDHTLHYTFSQPLDAKTGKLTGHAIEKLEVNGKELPQDSPLMKMIHEKMEEYILPKSGTVRGVTPMNANFSVHYRNIAHGDREVDWIDYHGVVDFVEKHHGIFIKDEQHKQYEREKREFEEKKLLGPYEVTQELTTLIKQYEFDLKMTDDIETKNKIKDEIKKLKEMIKERSDVDQKMLEDLIRQEMLIRHPTEIVHEKREIITGPVHTSMLKYAIAIPEPDSIAAKEFLSLAAKYGGRNLDRWFDGSQILQLARTVVNELKRLRVLHLNDAAIVKRLDDDAERFQKLLPEFIKDLKVRLDLLKKHSEADYEALKKNRDTEWVNSSDKITEVLEGVKNIFKPPATVATLPPPKSENAKKLISLLYSYNITNNPSPKLWLEPDDLEVLARNLNSAVSIKMNKELSAKKPKGISEEEWQKNINQIRMSYEQDLQLAEKLFPEFIKDLKERRDEFAKSNPLEYGALAARSNVHWVDNVDRVNKLLQNITRDLREPLKPIEKKQPSVKILEIGKYKALEGFLRSLLKGFLTLGERFKRLGLSPVAEDKDIAGYRSDQAKLRGELERIQDDLRSQELTEEEKDSLLKVRSELGKAWEKIQDVINTRESIPAIKGARILQSYAKYFSSLFSILSSMLWYRMKYSSSNEKFIISSDNVFYITTNGTDWTITTNNSEVPLDTNIMANKTGWTITTNDPEMSSDMKCQIVVTATNPEKDDKGPDKDRETRARMLQDEIYRETHYLAGLSLKSKEAIKEALSNLKALLSEFLDLVMVKEKTSAEKKDQHEYEEAYQRYAIPEDMLHHSKSIVEKMKRHSNSKIRSMAPIAEKELTETIKNLVEVFRKKATDHEIEEMAKKKKISPEKAAIQLRRHKDAMIKAIMDKFILSWSDIIRRADEGLSPKKKEVSPLGNKPPSEYDRMGKFVEDHLPELFSLVPPEEEPEEPSPGIPTPKELRESIEWMWSLHRDLTPEELSHLWKIEADEMGIGGGHGRRRKVRSKPVKTPPPSGVWNQIVNNVASKIKEIMKKPGAEAVKEVEHLVVETLMRQVLIIKKRLAELGPDEYIPVDDVIDSLVFLVKQLFFVMLNLKVQPSSRQLKVPPKGAPDFTGTPDIAIDSLDEALLFFNTFRNAVDVINEYLEPHRINIPKLEYVPPTGPKKIEKYLPNGLAETIHFFQLKEKGIERPSEMMYKPLEHIPGEVKWSTISDPLRMSMNITSKFSKMKKSSDEIGAILS